MRLAIRFRALARRAWSFLILLRALAMATRRRLIRFLMSLAHTRSRKAFDKSHLGVSLPIRVDLSFSVSPVAATAC
eukprot:4652122-Alexandrium_andersonii.AAC.1